MVRERAGGLPGEGGASGADGEREADVDSGGGRW